MWLAAVVQNCRTLLNAPYAHRGVGDVGYAYIYLWRMMLRVACGRGLWGVWTGYMAAADVICECGPEWAHHVRADRLRQQIRHSCLGHWMDWLAVQMS